MDVLKSLFLVLFLFLVPELFGQDAALSALQQQFDTYQQRTLQEKVYVHTDKSTYLAGEILWFKLYNVDAAQRTPLSVSKVAYVDVLDGKNQFLTQVKIPVAAGRGAGSVLLPLSTTSGHYKLRAYTAWMKNFGPEHFFQKPITIINTLKALPAPDADTAAYAVRFFPEGGNLVNGLESTVAVQVTASNGAGQPFHATIVTEAGDSIAAVRSLQFGMGRVHFTPAVGHTYSAVVTLPSGNVIKKALPAAAPQGYVMQLRPDARGTLALAVSLSPDLNDRVVYLLAHHPKKLQMAAAQQVQNGKAVFVVDTAALAAGITYLTICNEARKPVCERLYFKKPAQQPTLQLRSDQLQYSIRKKVELVIQAPSLDTTLLDLSLAVYKNDALQESNRNTIFSYLWLTSELNGGVEAPDYYFSSDTNVAEATENLLLTHGWRRFGWAQISGPPAFTFAPEVAGPLLKAVVTDGRSGKPAAGINTYLSIPGNPFQFLASQSDSAGIALFELKNHFGPGELIFQTNTAYDSGYRIAVQPSAAETFTADALPPFTFSKAHAEILLQQSIGMQAQHIYRRDSLDRFRPPSTYDTVPFYGQPEYSYLLDAYTRFPTMEEVLREYVRPINVVQRRGGLHLLLLDEPRKRFFDGDELVLLDGIPLFQKNRIFAYDPLKVRKLDIFTRKYFIGARFFNGVASFTTYNGNHEDLQLDPNAIVIDYEGLQLEREFYAPVYETAQQAQSRVPDFRSTLLWRPHVAVNGGSATLSFYTSDVKGTYLVAVEGLNKSGNAYTGQLSIEVK